MTIHRFKYIIVNEDGEEIIYPFQEDLGTLSDGYTHCPLLFLEVTGKEVRIDYAKQP